MRNSITIVLQTIRIIKVIYNVVKTVYQTPEIKEIIDDKINNLKTRAKAKQEQQKK
jgi:hypothetical protein